jgi:hypothetical protein
MPFIVAEEVEITTVLVGAFVAEPGHAAGEWQEGFLFF